MNKKIAAALVALGIGLLPAAAAFAETTVVISGVVATPTGSTPTDATTTQDIPVVRPLPPGQAKKVGLDTGNRGLGKKTGQITDDSATSSIWQDPSLIDNSGWKLG